MTTIPPPQDTPPTSDPTQPPISDPAPSAVRRGRRERGMTIAWVVLVAVIVTGIHFGIQRASFEPGVWSASVDDTYIGFQYARNIAHGHFFKYHPEDSYSTGFTCPLWAVFLVVPYLLGVGELQMVPVIILYGGLFLALSMLLLIRIGRQLHNAPAGKLAALLWGTWGFSWFCVYNGMEAGLYVTLVLAAASLFIAWSRRVDTTPSWKLLACLAVLPLTRPEALFLVGGLLGVVGLRELRRWRSPRSWRALALWACTLLPTAAYFISNKILTGTFSSAGMISKSLTHAPYLRWHEIALQYGTQLLDTVKDFLTGNDPLYLSWVVSASGMVAIFALGYRELRRRIVGVYFLFALWTVTTILAGSAYNIRIAHWPRYYVPFYLFVFLGVGLAITWLAQRLRRRGIVVGAAIVLVFFQSYGSFRWAKIYERDIGITHTKQSAAGRELRKLPKGTRVLICDAGAIPYLSHLWTYDIIGLTTPIPYNYFRNGVGSRFELFERLPPAKRPTYVATYDFCLWPGARGAPLSVHHDMIVAPLIESGAGSGEQPASLAAGARVVDRVDVADVQNEEEHAYRLWPPGAITDNILRRARVPGRPTLIVDGGRKIPGSESFRFQAQSGQAATLIGRFSADRALELSVEVNGRALPLKVPATASDAYAELALQLPAGIVQASNQVTIRRVGAGPPFASYHYFVLQGAR
jgi:hypothetical protein